MKVLVDLDLCESNAICMQVCPEVFRINDRDELELLDENPPEALREKLEEAVQRCPRQVITIED